MKEPLPIVQTGLPADMRDMRALPGVQPLDMAQWLSVDDAYGAQMRYRRWLLAHRRDQVLAEVPGSQAAQREALAMVLEHLAKRDDFEVGHDNVICPDGHCQSLSEPPLQVLGAIVQDDMCLLQKPKGSAEHWLTAGLLCFPASWRLTEKIGRPLGAIHDPVAEYDDQMARRVQRLFDGVKAGRPLWRFNRLWYADPDLYQPRSADAPRVDGGADAADFMRSERQCILRLPQSGAVLFSIHTFVLTAADAKRAIF